MTILRVKDSELIIGTKLYDVTYSKSLEINEELCIYTGYSESTCIISTNQGMKALAWENGYCLFNIYELIPVKYATEVIDLRIKDIKVKIDKTNELKEILECLK